MAKVTNIQQYIELVYSEKSELNVIQDLDERKKTACEKAKLDYAADATQAIIHMRNKEVNEQIFDFLIANNPEEFILYISDQHLFGELQKRQMKTMKDEDSDSELKDLELKTKISEKSEQLLERIKSRRAKLFGGKEEQEAAGKIRMLRPEERLKGKKSA